MTSRFYHSHQLKPDTPPKGSYPNVNRYLWKLRW